MLPFLLLGTVAIVLIGGLVYQHAVTRKLNVTNWGDLLHKLEPVQRASISSVAEDYLKPQPNQLGIEPMEIWTALDGLQGIKRMRRNAEVVIALASYAERWNFNESVIVAERIRRDALQLRRATLQITVRMTLGAGRLQVPFYLHEAAASYHLMTERLLALYQTSHAGLYPQLAETLG